MRSRRSGLLAALNVYALLSGGCAGISPVDYDSELKIRRSREPYSVIKSKRDDGTLFRETYLFVDSDDMAIVEYGPERRRSVTWYRLKSGWRTETIKKVVVSENDAGIELIGEGSIGD